MTKKLTSEERYFRALRSLPLVKAIQKFVDETEGYGDPNSQGVLIDNGGSIVFNLDSDSKIVAFIWIPHENVGNVIKGLTDSNAALYNILITGLVEGKYINGSKEET